MRLLIAVPAVVPRIRPVWIVVEAVRKFARDDAMPMAASIAYYALLSIFPLMLGIIAVSSLFVDQLEVRQAIMQTLSEYLPNETTRFLDRSIAEALRARGTFGLLAAVILFWSATAVAAMIRHTLNRIWGVQQPRPYLFRKVVELTLMLMVGLFMVTSLITSAVLRLAEAYPALSPAVTGLSASPLGRLLSVAATVILATLGFLVIYRYLPNVKIPWKNAIVGALVAGLLFEAAKRAFFWYLQTFALYQLVYGSVTGVILFLVWMFLSALILLFGAEVAFQIGRPYPQEVGEA